MSMSHDLRDSFNLRGAPILPEVEEVEEESVEDFRLANPYRMQREGFIAFAVKNQKLYRLFYDATSDNADSHIASDGRTEGRMEAIIYVSDLAKPNEIIDSYHFGSNDDDSVVGDFGIIAVGKYLYLIAKYSTASLAPNYDGNPVSMWQLNISNHRVRNIISGDNNFNGVVVDGNDMYLVMNESGSYQFNSINNWSRVSTGDVYSLDQESLEYTKLESEGGGEIRMIYQAERNSPSERRRSWHGVWYVDEDGYAWNSMVIDDKAASPSHRHMLWAGLAAWRWKDLPSFLDNGTATAQYIDLVTGPDSYPERELGAIIGLDYTPNSDNWEWDTDNFSRNLGFHIDDVGVPRVSFLRNIRLDMSPGAEGKFTHLFRTGIDNLIDSDETPSDYVAPSWRSGYVPRGYEFVGANIENSDDFENSELHFIDLDRGTIPGSEPKKNWRWSISVEDSSIADFVYIPQTPHLYFVGLDSGTTDVTVSVNDGVQITELVTFRITWDLPDTLEPARVLFFQGSSQDPVTSVEIVANDIQDLREIFTEVEERIYVGSDTGSDRREPVISVSEGEALVDVEEGDTLPQNITIDGTEYSLKRLHIELDGTLLDHEGRAEETVVVRALVPGEALVSGDEFLADSETLTITIKLDVAELNPIWYPQPDWSPEETGDRDWTYDNTLLLEATGGDDLDAVEVDLSESVVAGADDVTFSIPDDFSSTVISASVSGETLTITGLTEGDAEVDIEATDGNVVLDVGTFNVSVETYEPPTLVDGWYPPEPWDPQETGDRSWSRDAIIGSDFSVSVDLSGSVEEGNAGEVEFDYTFTTGSSSEATVSISGQGISFTGITEDTIAVSVTATDNIMATPLTVGTFTIDYEDEYVELDVDTTWTPGSGWDEEDEHEAEGQSNYKSWTASTQIGSSGQLTVDFNDSIIHDEDATITWGVVENNVVRWDVDDLEMTITGLSEEGIEITVTAQDVVSTTENGETTTEVLKQITVAVLKVSFEYMAFVLNPDYDPGGVWRQQSRGSWPDNTNWWYLFTDNTPAYYVRSTAEVSQLVGANLADSVIPGSRPHVFSISSVSANVSSYISNGREVGYGIENNNRLFFQAFTGLAVVSVSVSDGRTSFNLATFRLQVAIIPTATPDPEPDEQPEDPDETPNPTDTTDTDVEEDTTEAPDDLADPSDSWSNLSFVDSWNPGANWVRPDNTQRRWVYNGTLTPTSSDLTVSFASSVAFNGVPVTADTSTDTLLWETNHAEVANAENISDATLSGLNLTIETLDTGGVRVRVYVFDNSDRQPGWLTVAELEFIISPVLVFSLNDEWSPGNDWEDTGETSSGVQTWRKRTPVGFAATPTGTLDAFNVASVNFTNAALSTHSIYYTAVATSLDATLQDNTEGSDNRIPARTSNINNIYALNARPLNNRTTGSAVVVVTAYSGGESLTVGHFTTNFANIYVPIRFNNNWDPGSDWQAGNLGWTHNRPYYGSDNRITVELEPTGAPNFVLTHIYNKPWRYEISVSHPARASAQLDDTTKQLTITGKQAGVAVVTVTASDIHSGGTGVFSQQLILNFKKKFVALQIDSSWEPEGWESVGASSDRIWQKSIRVDELVSSSNFLLRLTGSVIKGSEDYAYNISYSGGSSGRYIEFSQSLSSVGGTLNTSGSTNGDYVTISPTNHETIGFLPPPPGTGQISIYADDETRTTGETTPPQHVGTFRVNILPRYQNFSLNPDWFPVASSHPDNQFTTSTTNINRLWHLAGSTEHPIVAGPRGTVIVDIHATILRASEQNIDFEPEILTPNNTNVVLDERNGRWHANITGRMASDTQVRIWAFDPNRKTNTRRNVAQLDIRFTAQATATQTVTWYVGTTPATELNLSLPARAQELFGYRGIYKFSESSTPIYYSVNPPEVDSEGRLSVLFAENPQSYGPLRLIVGGVSGYKRVSGITPWVREVTYVTIDTGFVAGVSTTIHTRSGTLRKVVGSREIDGVLYQLASADLTINVTVTLQPLSTDIKFFDIRTRTSVSNVSEGGVVVAEYGQFIYDLSEGAIVDMEPIGGVADSQAPVTPEPDDTVDLSEDNFISPTITYDDGGVGKTTLPWVGFRGGENRTFTYTSSDHVAISGVGSAGEREWNIDGVGSIYYSEEIQLVISGSDLTVGDYEETVRVSVSATSTHQAAEAALRIHFRVRL